MSIDRLQARAEAALRLGRYDEAQREAGQMIAAAPENSTGYAMLARAFLGKAKPAAAQRAAEDGLARSPEREWLHRLRCHALRLQQRYDEALEEARTCVRLLPNESQSHAVLGKALAAKKEREAARDAYRCAIALDPEDGALHRELGDLWLDTDPQVAERSYRKALEIDPNDALALNNLGVVFNKTSRPKEAALAFKAAILADPTVQVAKRNAHSTVNARVGKAVGWGGALYGLLQIGRLASAQGAAIALLLGGCGAAWFGVRRLWRSRRIAELKREDPQLWSIFEKVEGDRKAGRL